MKKRRLRYDRIFILIGFILLIIVICFLLFRNDSNKASSKEVKMPLVVNKNISSIDDLVKNSELILEKVYEYSDELEKDFIISQSITEGETVNKGDKLVITVSLGKLDKEKLAQDNINELGRVPVMMYHGIVNKKSSETSYTGGNVDKDGYNRTVEAFKEDLEFYYQNGYRMIRAIDYVNGIIDVPYGKSPIVLTFDDGSANNIKVNGISEDGEIIIDENSAVGVLESFKKKYPDFNVTATFFVNGSLFQQSEYNEKILKWLVDNGYDIGNHTKTHLNIGKSNASQVQSEIAYVYKQLDKIIPNKYVKIIALPFGSPTNKSNDNFKYVLNGTSGDYQYETMGALRVGWEPEISSYNKDFDRTYIKRCRAYDNNGKEFDIEMILKMLDKTKYVSDGNANTIVSSIDREKDIIETDKEIILY